jgi:hypothetical protein
VKILKNDSIFKETAQETNLFVSLNKHKKTTFIYETNTICIMEQKTIIFEKK